MYTKKNNSIFLLVCIVTLVLSLTGNFRQPVYAQETPPTPDSAEGPHSELEVISPYFSIVHQTMANGEAVSGYIINGPPEPLPGFERESIASIQPLPSAVSLANFPSYSWVFGCSAVSSAMIAAYYDRGAYPNMYTGPTNGGVMPLTDTSWPTWMDVLSEPYPNNPLIASHNGVDGRTAKGSIDDYWVSYGSTANDPYLSGSWTQHNWGTAVGDYMKTSQSSSGNVDGSTLFYTYTSSAERLNCSYMHDVGIDVVDGTYGRKLFYEAKGYTVTDCYNQRTDSKITGGFSLAQFKAEIDAGHPVLLNLAGHSIVGFGYDGSTVYLRDTWDNNIAHTYSMQWGGSYDGMELLSVSIVHLQASTPVKKIYLPLILQSSAIPTPSVPTSVSASDGIYTDKVNLTWASSAGATYYQVFRHTSNNSASAITLSTNHPSSPYDDTSAVAGTPYYYWVKACNSGGCSNFSASDAGYRASVVPAPTAPTSVSASDGIYTDKVNLTWASSAGATYYQVFRHTSNNSASAITLSTNHLSSPYEDTSAVAGTPYYYWVKACNSGGCSNFSASDAGYRASVASAIANGNFDQGHVAWTEYSSNGWEIIVPSADVPEGVTAHSGDWLAWLGGDDLDTSYVSQVINIPSQTPYLHYWYWIASDDSCDYDYFRIKIGATTLNTVDLCDSTNTSTWVEGVLNLTAHAGLPVTLMFEVTTDISVNSNLFLDTISLQGSASAFQDVPISIGGDVGAATKTLYNINQD